MVTLTPIDAIPEVVDDEFVASFRRSLHEYTHANPVHLRKYLPKDFVLDILRRTQAIVAKEATLVEIIPDHTDPDVVVVGDTHGQFHDVCELFRVAGDPSQSKRYIVNGDMVDRGAWGLETLLLFCVHKLKIPDHVHIIRGNHETATCAIMYGFKQEVETKYGKTAGKSIFAACKQLFKALPLAALISRNTLVLHGGLFRHTARAGQKRKHTEDFVVGSIDDLRHGSKGGLDPSGFGQSKLAADVLWSDPAKESGFKENDGRGIGMVFGPEVTECFLRENKLKLIIRSHEGPDAREARPEMPNMLEGYTTDHETSEGVLMTVFSAPDYPQFINPDASRYKNKAAVFILKAPDYINPEIRQFEAVLPRPHVTPYYDLDVPDSDSDEFEQLGADVSGMSDTSHTAGIEGEEVAS
ncbi:hypothetical protein M9434_000246 [Picochlorum sp. BPE23]|nr:hypothetical protein M9434_000246 [Picochlorum sp. BPE23]KAI8106276.1 hypothetical protein M9435_000822 [Picochlorum sp. BPE23]